jgi:hypothetical protein
MTLVCSRQLLLVTAIVASLAQSASAQLKAGAHTIDISPRILPAIRNGGFLQATADRVDDPLQARCLALSDGKTTLCIAIVDSCMVPTDVCDEVKQRAAKTTGVPADRILVAATHTHSAPSLMSYCLGTQKDPAYADYFIPRVAEGIAKAHAALAPAKAGWAVAQAPNHTHSRRWLHRPDDYPLDPFGEKSVRAMMHPGYQNPKYLGPSGPVDTALTILSIQSSDGRPLAVLANYSMHYFGNVPGSSGFSADYFGDFANHLQQKLDSKNPATPFVAIMSQGTSGDLHWMDYSQPERKGYTRQQYAEELGSIALQAIQRIEYRADVGLAMAQTRLTLSRRLPSPARIGRAEKIDQARGARRPKDLPEVYAEQALWIRDHPATDLVLQAARIGELGLAAIPNEVFAITGLKLKAQSPLTPLMNLELANGAEGYIPPPEQHFLGGYTTWPARTAGLETDAEPKIVEAILKLLEQVSGEQGRRPSSTSFYTPEQVRIMEQARRDDNNRENRGAARP